MIERVVHLVNYGWPHIDGYTVRTAGLVTAQQRHLGLDTTVAVSPFEAFSRARDLDYSTDAWHDGQTRIGRTADWERPGLGLSPISRRTMVDDLVQLGRRVDAQVIHAHHPHYLAAVARRAADRLGVAMVYEVRCFNGDYDLDRRHPYFSRVRGPLFNAAEYREARRADAVVTISDGLADRLREHDVENVHVVRNSVDTERFRPMLRSSDDVPGHSVGHSTGHSAGHSASRSDGGDRSSSDGERRVFRIGYATTFEPIESLDVLVEALVIARRELADEVDLQAVVAGTGREFEAITALRDRVADASWLSLPGFVPFSTMPEFLAELDAFIVPRGDAAVVQHTTPLKPLEALACGVPIVSTQLPALRELFGTHPDVRFTGIDASSMAEGIVAEARDPRRANPDAMDRTWESEIVAYRDVYGSLA